MRSRISVLAAVALGSLVALGGIWMVVGQARDGQRYVSEHSTPVPETARTVALSTTMPMPSAHARHLSAMLEAGEMPHGPMMGEVLTDTDCAPDAHMVSRCRNEVELADGRTIVLRHPHDMSNIPCLAPGERVRVVPTSA